jgi:general secretion pathway protein G
MSRYRPGISGETQHPEHHAGRHRGPDHEGESSGGHAAIIIDRFRPDTSRMSQMQHRRARKGFTLIELMVVLVIIGVLAALIVPNVLDRADDARVTAARTDVNNLMQALKLYRLDNQRYPSAEQGLDALLRKPTTGAIPPNWRPYLDKLPNDPWGRPYQYVNPGVKGEIDVFSFGADGQPGGDARNADIGSWQ